MPLQCSQFIRSNISREDTGEIGRFYHDTMGWTFLFCGWGLATGIGLLRAWRWARVSTLIFSGLLIPSGILGIVVFLLMPAGGSLRLDAYNLKNCIDVRVSDSDCGRTPVAIFLYSERSEGLFSNGFVDHRQSASRSTSVMAMLRQPTPGPRPHGCGPVSASLRCPTFMQ